MISTQYMSTFCTGRYYQPAKARRQLSTSVCQTMTMTMRVHLSQPADQASELNLGPNTVWQTSPTSKVATRLLQNHIYSRLAQLTAQMHYHMFRKPGQFASRIRFEPLHVPISYQLLARGPLSRQPLQQPSWPPSSCNSRLSGRSSYSGSQKYVSAFEPTLHQDFQLWLC